MQHHIAFTAAAIAATLVGTAAKADFIHDFEDLSEGMLGNPFTYQGVTYRDLNTVDGFYADGVPFFASEFENHEFIIEDATYFYDEFAEYGSPANSLTFGIAYIPGPNLSIGGLASVWMDLDEMGTAVSFDIGYYENGVWGGIEYILEAYNGDELVGSDSFTISDLGGKDNSTFSTMSLGGVEFDSLHLYAWKDGAYTMPRGMIDDFSITTVPGPGALALFAAAGLIVRRRR